LTIVTSGKHSVLLNVEITANSTHPSFQTVERDTALGLYIHNLREIETFEKRMQQEVAIVVSIRMQEEVAVVVSLRQLEVSLNRDLVHDPIVADCGNVGMKV
jgi:hypothetical protein